MNDDNQNQNNLKKDLEQEFEQDDVNVEPADGSDDIVVDEEAELSSGELIKKLRTKLKTALDEKQKYLTSWQKDKAEFINARKRDEESKSEFLKFAQQGMVEDLLPVIDSFDMAMSNKTAWESVSKEWRTGVEGIYQQFQTFLSKNNVSSFGAAGDAFDPNLHHSIGSVPTDNKSADHTLAEILQKGYKIRDKVIRPALVKIFEINS